MLLTGRLIDWALDESKEPFPYEHETADIINFSAGFTLAPKYYGYSDSAKFFDVVVDDLHVMAVIAAGNEGPSGVLKPGELYNGLTVANMKLGVDKYDRSDDIAAESSSEGPAGGRKKPDVIAPGHYINTTRRDYAETGEYFGTWTNGDAGPIEFKGTSFAAPHVTGAIALLYDYLSAWPATLKAVLINTADDWVNPEHEEWGPGWDKKHGWGYINLETALVQWHYDEVGLNPAGSSFDRYYWSGSMDPDDKITAVWNREVDYNYPNPPTVYALDNLDLFLYDVNGNLLDSSDSDVDNVEQVVYNGETPKNVLVEVRNMTSDSDAYVAVAFPSNFSREGGSSYEFQFLTGLNLIGLPVEPITQYTSYTLIPAIENCNAVSKWDAHLQLWRDAILIESGIIIGENFSIALGEGYFLLLAANTQWPLFGNSIIEAINLELKGGLNLISIPYPPNTYTSHTLIPAIGIGNCNAVSRWDANLQLWRDAILIESGIIIGEDFPIETDEGYFVLVAEDTSFTPQAAAPPLAQEKKNPALQEPKELFPKISNVTHANITSKSATIFWNTDIAADGIVHCGTTPALGLIAKDARGDSTNHWVVVKDLKESETYYYRVVSGKSIEDNDGLLFKFTTSKISLRKKMDSSVPVVVYGQVLLLDNGEKAEGEIILLTVSNQSGDSLPLATLTDKNGYWLINLWNLKDSVGKVFNYQVGDKLLIDDKALGIRLTTEITEGALQDTGLQIAPVMSKKAVAEIPEEMKGVVEIPEEMKLAQNFPNPFNPDTWIPYQLSESAQVVIKIYNVQGQLIRTLSLGRKDAGYYTTKERAGYWDGRNTQGEQVASGVYFYYLTA